MGSFKHRPKSAKRRSRKAHVAPPGAAPGTLIVDPLAQMPAIRVFGYGPDTFTEQLIEDVHSVQDYLGKWPVLWIDVDGLGNIETIRQLGEIFHLHPLALEDVLNVYQRPKVEHYGDHYFIVSRMASYKERLETEQLSLFLGDKFVLTFQESLPGDCLEPVRQRIRSSLGRLRQRGSDYLAYALLDAVVDSNFPVLEQLGELLEGLEDQVLNRNDQQALARVHAIKRDLLVMRRACWPLRDALQTLLREPISIITEDTRVYLRDCYDHTLRIIELVETDRELCADLIDLYLSSVNNRMSEVMKVLTVFSSIFIPLTFICSIYGMNFNTAASPWNMPELNWYFGYPLALLLMAVVAMCIGVFIWRKGWLAPLSPKKVDDDDPLDRS